MKKIYTKLLVGFLVVIVVLTSAVSYFSYNIITDNYKKTLQKNLENLNYTLSLEIIRLIEKKDYYNLDSTVKKLGKIILRRITIIAPDGVVLADSEKNPFEMENHTGRPEIRKAFSKGYGISLRYSVTVKKNMMYVAIPLKSKSNEIIGVSRISVYMYDVDNLIGSLRTQILKIVFIAIILSLIFASQFSRVLTLPIKKLVDVAKYVGAGKFDIKAIINNKDELKLLADSFNDMISKINELFKKLNKQSAELKNIISSIQEGLVVLDFQGKIILCNESFNKILSNKNLIGKYYWEAFRENKINKLVKKATQLDKNISHQIYFRERYYLCSINHINQQKELVLIFYDISELKKLDIIKRDLVINVSHELRTPLTVIKGYVETMEDNINQENKKYLNIIKNHTERLINIVNDLSIISRLEEKNIKPDKSEINLKLFFDKLKDTFQQKSGKKGLSINFNIDKELINLYADEYKIEQMFINLIDNAIKYTEKGSISINAVNENNNIKIEVTDTGIGIPQKDISRIFERFYTVDKSRSRQMAGTGLGLSIVKHIVTLHKGKISVESEPDKGTKFTILLPNLK